jgi:endonuclease/exonuclease/phosphatase family metal-dependent hydrolase
MIGSTRQVRIGAVAVGLVLTVIAAAACSSSNDAEGDRSASTPPDATASSTEGGTDDADLRVVTYNVLHGLPLGNCPAETEGCRAATRLDLTWQLVEEAGCPEVIALQEVGPDQQEHIPATLPDVCDGAYRVVSDDPNLPVEQWILSSLPVLDAASEPISGISRSVQWVRLDAAMGPVDVVTTHFVADVDNLPCTEDLCGELCELGVEAGACNPVEVLDFLDRHADPSIPTILTGDLNARIDEPRLRTLTDAGFVDVWTEAGNAECDAATGEGCTAGLSGDGPYDGLDQPTNGRGSRIDFILVRAPDDCELSVDGPSDGDGDGTSTGPFAGEPFDPPVDGIAWPSDHVGVQADLSCA